MKRFQVSNCTGMLRYSNIFMSLYSKNLIPERSRILIFGCSSGQEIATVGSIWPFAQVSACDIDEDVLQTAKEANPRANVFLSTDENLANAGTFDLVCANSVVCRNPLPPEDEIPAEFPISDVSDLLNTLVNLTKPGGFLMAYNLNHLVSDCDVSANLQPTSVARSWCNSFIPRLTKEGKIIANPKLTEDKKVLSYSFKPNAKINLSDLICPLFQRVTERVQGIHRIGDDVSDFHVTSAAGIAPPDLDRNIFAPYFVSEEGVLNGRVARCTHTYVKIPFTDAWYYLGAHVKYLVDYLLDDPHGRLTEFTTLSPAKSDYIVLPRDRSMS